MKVWHIITWLTVGIITIFQIYKTITQGKFDVGYIGLIALIFLAYALKDKLRMLPVHYGLFCAFLIIHAMEAFDFYSQHFMGVRYDVYVHLLGGVVAGLIFYRFFSTDRYFKGWKAFAATFVVVAALGGIHEINEYFGVLFGLKTQQWLFDGNAMENIFDTQKDMVNNIIGMVVGVGSYMLWARAFPTTLKQRKVHALARRNYAH